MACVTMRLHLGVIILSFVACPFAQAKPVNLVFILTDNHGAWTLGCYGNPDIRTPHIDALAKQGMLFEKAFASNAVCSPTRATLLTGLIPSQHGVHCYLAANRLQVGAGARSTISMFSTLPGILQSLGYTCGMIGKWHLGDNARPQCGFSAWVTMPHGATQEFYNQNVIEDGKVRKEATYLTDFWTQRACRFIAENKTRPFFLYLAYNGPYGLGASMLNPPRNRHAEHYAGKAMKSFPREKMHPWLHSTKQLHNNETSMRRYASEISAVDDGVGQVLAALKEHALDENTLVVFTGDQGLAGGHGGIWGMGDHTRPLSAFDSTMHVPLIVRHTGHIKADQRSPRLIANYDITPTLLHYLGHGERARTTPRSPGRDFTPLLLSRENAWEDVVFFEFENVRAIRTADWKYVERFRQQPNELYDLRNDADQRKNLHEVADYAERRTMLQERLHAFFRTYAQPRRDLWRGGKSQSNIISVDIFGKDAVED